MFQRGRYGLNEGKEEGRLRLALFICVEITMPKGPFLPSDFTATKFSTAADKAEFGNTLLHILDAGCPRELFTKKSHNRLSMTFGNIAHNDIYGFYSTWFKVCTGRCASRKPSSRRLRKTTRYSRITTMEGSKKLRGNHLHENSHLTVRSHCRKLEYSATES